MNRSEHSMVRLGLAIGVLMGLAGCAAHVAPVVETETVGNLQASYNSIAVQPVHHDEPPVMGQLAGSADDDGGRVATTVTRVDAGEQDAAPEVEAKNAHGF